MDSIYFDHAATTPLDERVLEAMLPYFKSEFGNASSTHQKGQAAKVALENSREIIAELINAEPSEIIFTSGGTESNNAIIKGVLEVSGGKNEILTSPLEHHAVLHTVELTKRTGGHPLYLDTNPDGSFTAEQVKKFLTDKTALVSLMHVNNEIGSINPVGEIADVCREMGVPFHTDAVQSVGKIPLDVKELGVDFLSISGHKLYGPKGIGVMYIRNGAPWIPFISGGSQERRRRGGTSNIPAIVGLAKAMELSIAEMDDLRSLYIKLRKKLFEKLDKNLSSRYQVNGPISGGVPHIINLGFQTDEGGGLDGEMLLLNLDIEGICVSNGSACTSGAVEPSHVLSGIGIDKKIANASIRVSFGKSNTFEEIDYFVKKLEKVLTRMLTTAS